jgi:hypothetical protein
MTLEQRVQRLERSNRWWRGGCIAAIALIAGLGATTNPSANPSAEFDHLTVQSLSVRSEPDGPQINISADKDQASVRITTRDAVSSTALMCDADGATLLLSRHAKSDTIGATIRADDQSAALLLRGNGKSKELEPE